MKPVLFLILFTFFGAALQAQTSNPKISVPDSTKKIMTVEASCGLCQFGMKAGGCELAIRIDGKSYFVDGTKIDDHGDAHANDGFCSAIRKAEVQGELVNNRFKVTYFKLLKTPGQKKAGQNR